jgi:poly(3-hydroxybutyrate) depolymerase
MNLRHLLSVATLVLSIGLPAHAGRVLVRTVTCEGQPFNYLLTSPLGENTASGKLPAVLLLHGAGDKPAPMIDAWHSLADKERIVLIAPELPRTREFEDIAPRVFRCIVEDSKQAANIDPRRIYVFGNSMGGYLAYDTLAFDSEYFAAVGVHAMGIDPQYDSILDHATRKTPVTIYIGDHDPLVTLKSVRRTVDLLKKRGFPVRYNELKNHDHNYYAVSAKVNADAWEFFLGQHLP